MIKNLVFQSDFGLVDGAVCAMHGISYNVCPNLKISDLTHDIPAFNIWEASYRLFQTVKFWPKGTVFVSVVDPGVGSSRKSIVVKLKDDKYIVTPNNGTLTHLKTSTQVEEVREIDETVNRLNGSENIHTFHGRDIYAYTGAKLASEIINFENIGKFLNIEEIVTLPVLSPKIIKKTDVKGNIDILDIRFGSLWTNIPENIFEKANLKFGDQLLVKISNSQNILYSNILIYEKAFSNVKVGNPIVYVNSLSHIAVAINQGNFATTYKIDTGINWSIEFKKIN